MSKNIQLQVFKSVITDYIAAVLAWITFSFIRKSYELIGFNTVYHSLINDKNFWLGLIIVPLFWLMLYLMIGTYRNIFVKSRLHDLKQLIIIVLGGGVFLFFVLILDDHVTTYKGYYKYFFILILSQFIITYIFRIIILNSTKRKIKNKEIVFNTLIVGGGDNALYLYNELSKKNNYVGNYFCGYITVLNNINNELSSLIPNLGKMEDLENIIAEKEIEEVIIALERSEFKTIEKIISVLEKENVIIKIKPILQDILLGTFKSDNVNTVPLIVVNPEPLPLWQKVIKRSIDILVSSLVLILLSPLYLIVSILVKRSSEGPVFYGQERIGKHGKPFMMYKFRSMYTDAESSGPKLSSKDDNRVTPIGKKLRKYRIDELPQFYTVLKGEMSIVGPRPERQYYIDQIIEKAPYYRLLLKVKPGITSWGQVKYGYAANIDEMIQRLPYDLMYVENMSLLMDLKILIYTVKIVLQGRGV